MGRWDGGLLGEGERDRQKIMVGEGRGREGRNGDHGRRNSEGAPCGRPAHLSRALPPLLHSAPPSPFPVHRSLVNTFYENDAFSHNWNTFGAAGARSRRRIRLLIASLMLSKAESQCECRHFWSSMHIAQKDARSALNQKDARRTAKGSTWQHHMPFQYRTSCSRH
eukprot:3699032-Rhodomonas_salina.1